MKFRRLALWTSIVLLLGTAISCQNPTPSESPAESMSQITQSVSTDTHQDTMAESDSEALTEVDTEANTEEITMDVIYETVQNPIHDGGADPWVVAWKNSYYYCYSTGNGVAVAKNSSLHQLRPNGKKVYVAPSNTAYSAEYWAPELHYIRGEWYIYVAADDGNNDNHRMYVLKGTSQDPMARFEMVGQITDPSNKWAIDGTVMEIAGELYFVWSGWKGNTNVAQNIYIAHMSDPCTIDSERVCLSTPTYTWEKQGKPYVNEGPTALSHDGKTFLVYSASGSWTDNYCLGMLTLTGDDPMNPDHWAKESQPVFQMKQGVCYGPGHCSFSTAVDGSVWMIYHGNLVSGSGWGGRSVWISPVTFDEAGKPNFGSPASEVQFPVGVR